MHRLRRRALGPLLLVSLLSIVFAAGCASFGKKPEPSGLSRIVQTGEIRIGTSGEQPPLTMTSKTDEPLGLDIALSRVLAKSMGVEPVFVQMPFNELIDAIEDGKVDLVMSGMTITPARGQRVTFIGPYYTSGKSLLTRDAGLAVYQEALDLNSDTFRFAALEGSTSEEFVRNDLPEAKLFPSEHLEEAIQLVMDGEVDALIADRETCAFAVLRHPEANLIASDATFTVEPMGIAVGLEEERLARLVQTYLTALDQSGALTKARDFWFKDPTWVKDLR